MKNTNNARSGLGLLLLAAVLGYAASASASPFVYVAQGNASTVQVIDAASNTVISTVPVCSHPAGVAVNPAGTRAYVSCLNSPAVSVINTATNTVTATVSLPSGSRSQRIAVSPDGTKAYVVIQDSNTVGVIDTATNTLVSTIGGLNAPSGIAITPDGTKAYITNFGVNHSGTTVSVIGLSTNTVIATVGVGNAPMEIAITPDGAKAYVVNREPRNVSVIDTASETVIATLAIAAVSVAIKPDGSEVWVPAPASGSVFVINPATDTTVATLPLGLFYLAFTSDGARVYGGLDGTSLVVVVDTATYAEITRVPLSNGNGLIAISPSLPALRVTIDIKPGSFPNSINLCSNGTVPIAVFGSDTFDVNDIDTETLRFAEAAVKVVGMKDPHTLCSLDDIDKDGFTDIVCHFVTADIAAVNGESSSANVNGELLDGTPIKGTDSVNIVKDTCN